MLNDVSMTPWFLFSSCFVKPPLSNGKQPLFSVFYTRVRKGKFYADTLVRCREKNKAFWDLIKFVAFRHEGILKTS